MDIYVIIHAKIMGLENDRVGTNDITEVNDPVTVNDQVHVENYALRSHGVSLSRAASSTETARHVDAAIGEQAAFPPRRDASAGSSETDNTPKSIQATEGPEDDMCHHQQVCWKGTNQRQWQWTCNLCGRVEKVWKMHGVDKPIPADHPSRNPFYVHPLKK